MIEAKLIIEPYLSEINRKALQMQSFSELLSDLFVCALGGDNYNLSYTVLN